MLKKILEKDAAVNDITLEILNLDMQTMWCLNRATTLVFGYNKDQSYITLNKEDNSKKPAGPTKAINFHSI